MAYGARLESVLGASPRGFELISLRQKFDFFTSLIGLNLIIQLSYTIYREIKRCVHVYVGTPLL